MYILVLPVSGNAFPSQLAIIQHLCEIQFIPDVTLASSGGNVAAYIASAAHWKWPAIERISRELNNDLFIAPWNSVAGLSLAIGYFQGNLYNRGDGVINFIKRHFTSESIVEHEIWTGTYNKDRQQARLFCNRASDKTILNMKTIDHELTHSMKPVFAAGDIELIAKASVASASIPAIVPAQVIDGEAHIDGGVAGASPLTIMQEPILAYSRKNGSSLHLIYVNSIDLSKTDIKPGKNVLDTLKQTTSDLVRSQTVNDRLAAYQLLRCHPGSMNKDEFTCNHENLKRVKKIQSKVRYSLLELYPIDDHDIDLVKFNGNDIVHAIRQNYHKCRARLWWISESILTTGADNSASRSEAEEDVHRILQECKNCM
jgi:predicted acylesterase/phospholipase RssA